jgi:hypothetical protein
MFRIAWMLLVTVMFVVAIMIQGCTFEGTNDTVVVDNSAPAAPRGVYSISGDEQVEIKWYPNQEKDLKGYVIYKSTKKSGDYKEINTVGAKVSSYIDNDVRNGNTYYYAISAIDFDGNESDLSPEIVEDTPRPEGKGVKLRDFVLDPDRSGLDFSGADQGAIAFDRKNTDIYFGVDTVVSVPYIYSDTDVQIQDLGYTDSMDEVDVSPVKGFTKLFVEAIVGHTYAFLTTDGNYAKIRVTDMKVDWVGNKVKDAWIVFDWAYQLQIDNPDLAPKKK